MITALKQSLIEKSSPLEARVFMCDACCCGDERFSAQRAPMKELREAMLSSLKESGMAGKCQVAMTGCMGPCEVGNNVILATRNRNFWFKKMNQPADLKALGQFAQSLNLNAVARLPEALKGKLARQETPPV